MRDSFSFATTTVMKLSQAQVWKKDGQFIRIVRLERLEVEYKSHPSLTSKAALQPVPWRSGLAAVTSLSERATGCWSQAPTP